MRQILAELGYTSLDQIIGRPGVLKQRDVKLKKATNVDLSFVLDALVCTPSQGEVWGLVFGGFWFFGLKVFGLGWLLGVCLCGVVCYVLL